MSEQATARGRLPTNKRDVELCSKWFGGVLGELRAVDNEPIGQDILYDDFPNINTALTSIPSRLSVSIDISARCIETVCISLQSIALKTTTGGCQTYLKRVKMDSQAQAQREYLKKYPLLLSPKASSVAATKQSPLSKDRRSSYRHTSSRHRSRSPLRRRPRSRRSISPLSSRDPQSVLSRNSNTRLSGSKKSTHRNNNARSRSRERCGRNQHRSARSRSRSDGPTTTKNKHVRVRSISMEHTSHDPHQSLHLISSSLTDPSELIVAFRSVSKSEGDSSRQHATLTEIPSSSLSEQTLSFTIDKKDYFLPPATPKRSRKETRLGSLSLTNEQRQSRSPSPSRDKHRGRHYGGDRRSTSPPRSAGQLGERKYRDRPKSMGFGGSLHTGLGSNDTESLKS